MRTSLTNLRLSYCSCSEATDVENGWRGGGIWKWPDDMSTKIVLISEVTLAHDIYAISTITTGIGVLSGLSLFLLMPYVVR